MHTFTPSAQKDQEWRLSLTRTNVPNLLWKLVNDAGFKTKDEARHALVYYVELYYNGISKHSALGHNNPREYEELNS